MAAAWAEAEDRADGWRPDHAGVNARVLRSVDVVDVLVLVERPIQRVFEANEQSVQRLTGPAHQGASHPSAQSGSPRKAPPLIRHASTAPTKPRQRFTTLVGDLPHWSPTMRRFAPPSTPVSCCSATDNVPSVPWAGTD